MYKHLERYRAGKGMTLVQNQNIKLLSQKNQNIHPSLFKNYLFNEIKGFWKTRALNPEVATFLKVPGILWNFSNTTFDFILVDLGNWI